MHSYKQSSRWQSVMIASRIYTFLTNVRISFTVTLLQNYLHIFGIKTFFGHTVTQ